MLGVGAARWAARSRAWRGGVLEPLGVLGERAVEESSLEHAHPKGELVVAEGVAQLELDATDHVHQHLAPAREHLLGRVRGEVEREARVDDEHRAVDLEVERLDAGEWREEHLPCTARVHV